VFPIGVARALRRWGEIQPKGKAARYVFGDGDKPINVDHLAEQLRDDLAAVGVQRRELFESTARRKRLVAHDLRERS
jgi:hypothetical protein